MTQPQKTRRQMLEEFAAAHPQDAFAQYGLALECLNSGDPGAAIAHFRKLLADHPDYVAGYQQLGQLLGRLARSEEAKEVLRAGMAAAQRAGNEHARSEMETTLIGLG